MPRSGVKRQNLIFILGSWVRAGLENILPIGWAEPQALEIGAPHCVIGSACLDRSVSRVKHCRRDSEIVQAGPLVLATGSRSATVPWWSKSPVQSEQAVFACFFPKRGENFASIPCRSSKT